VLDGHLIDGVLQGEVVVTHNIAACRERRIGGEIMEFSSK
jgi:hypothetical protein